MRRVFLLFLVAALCISATAQHKAPSKVRQAVRLYEEGLRFQENRRSYEAMHKWREAVRVDPDLAIAWAMLSIVEPNPSDAYDARERARTLIEVPGKNDPDALLIRWIVSRSETDLLTSVQAANDLTSEHSDEKHILWTVGSWFGFQMHQYDRDVALQQAALKLDPTFTPAYEELAFAYARLRVFKRAVEMIKHYAELTPNQPNSQDAYGEILRLAGKYPESLEHYRQALNLDPSFTSSQLGLGDTYALVGDQQKARDEYAKCISSGTLSTRLTCQKMSSYTYIRERNFDRGTTSLAEFTQKMHAMKRISLELEGLIALGLTSKDTNSALSYLDQALTAARASKTLLFTDREETVARVLAYKVRIAAAADRMDAAKKTQSELEIIGARTKDPVVYAAMHGGRGALSFYQKDYDRASVELQEDLSDVYSTLLLSRCFEKQGATDAASVIKGLISSQHTMDIDLCLVQQELSN